MFFTFFITNPSKSLYQLFSDKQNGKVELVNSFCFLTLRIPSICLTKVHYGIVFQKNMISNNLKAAWNEIYFLNNVYLFDHKWSV
ncbi:hypothetical protein KSF78_0003667 [Schistosoma japonicum]|nr:hypothetical protein KSF78_0003667 [Schistosoma japonicum]